MQGNGGKLTLWKILSLFFSEEMALILRFCVSFSFFAKKKFFLKKFGLFPLLPPSTIQGQEGGGDTVRLTFPLKSPPP